jgi:hypothetical protein
MERVHPSTHRCSFALLCSASMIALLVFGIALLLIG